MLNGSLTPGPSTPVTATAGTLVSGAPLVKFTDGTSPLPANEYAATIDWGDGTPLSGGTISVSGTTFTVEGSHNFAQTSGAQPNGVYTVTVVIDGDGQQVSATTTATVGGLTFVSPGSFPSPPSGGVTVPLERVSPPPVAGIPSLGLEIGFQGEQAADPAAYSATVDWGDGSTPTVVPMQAWDYGAIQANTSGHVYAVAGQYTVQIVVRDSQGFVVGTGSESMPVLNPSSKPLSQTATAGTPTGSLHLATFSTFPYSISDGQYYSATVDWGDGSPPAIAAITGSNGDAENVTTSGHTYARTGTYTLTVTFRDAEGFVVGMVQPEIVVQGATPGGIAPTDATGGAAPTATAIVPAVQAAKFNRKTGTAFITYHGGLSQAELAALTDAALYRVAADPLSARRHRHRDMRPTRISVMPGASGTSADVVKVVFDRGKPASAGRYVLTVQGTVKAGGGAGIPIDFTQVIRGRGASSAHPGA